MTTDNGKELLNAYREQTQLTQQLIDAVRHQTSVLESCIKDEFKRATIERMKEHNALDSKLNVGIVQMLAVFVSTVLGIFINR